MTTTKKRLYIPDMENVIIHGIARAMFASVWMDYQELIGEGLSCGEDGYELAPETPQYVLDEARKRAGQVEMLNGSGDMPTSLFHLACMAARADLAEERKIPYRAHDLSEKRTNKQVRADIKALEKVDEHLDEKLQDEAWLESFGSDLGMQIMGHGVSWFDDHAKFPLKLPYNDYTYYDLDDEYPIPDDEEEDR